MDNDKCLEEFYVGEIEKRRNRGKTLRAACVELASTDFSVFCSLVPDFPHDAYTSEVEMGVRNCEEIQPLLLVSSEVFLEEILSM